MRIGIRVYAGCVQCGLANAVDTNKQVTRRKTLVLDCNPSLKLYNLAVGLRDVQP